MDVEEGRARPTRRAVIATGAKLAYAAPLVAASMRLTNDSALAAADCACHDPDFVFDASPPLDQNSNPIGFIPACCTCLHCTYLGAADPVYDPATNECVERDTGQAVASGCYPECADICHHVSPA